VTLDRRGMAPDGRPLTAADVPALPGRPVVERLDNGLTVCLLANDQAPVVTTALWYRAGSRDEAPGQSGIAHFLEHLMFKGSRRYGPGDIDRRTQALGGANNAFTSHDATAYHFSFARDRWREALAIEADRMAGLTLDPDEVAAERQVILEEIAMAESEPWDALGTAVEAALFPDHPYGRPVLGTRADLKATGPGELAAFHRHFYRPDNAVMAVAGDLDEGALEAVAAAFAGIAPGDSPPPRPALAAAAPLDAAAGLRRITRRKGEVARALLALRGPAADHRDQPVLRLLATLLGGGRTSRLYRKLVDEEQLCAWVEADVGETVDPGSFTVALELVPGAEPARVEARLLAELAALAGTDGEELERAKRILAADWVFAHERVHQQALAAGFSLALFDLDFLDRELRAALAADGERVAEVAARWLRPERGGVLGWSLPRARRATAAGRAVRR
jgi:zinc protease